MADLRNVTDTPKGVVGPTAIDRRQTGIFGVVSGAFHAFFGRPAHLVTDNEYHGLPHVAPPLACRGLW